MPPVFPVFVEPVLLKLKPLVPPVLLVLDLFPPKPKPLLPVFVELVLLKLKPLVPPVLFVVDVFPPKLNPLLPVPPVFPVLPPKEPNPLFPPPKLVPELPNVDIFFYESNYWIECPEEIDNSKAYYTTNTRFLEIP